jgi:hypothetical protein
VYNFFTGENLDFEPKQKVYDWENCFSGAGYSINGYDEPYHRQFIPALSVNRLTYPTVEDAEAARAHCQLLYIVNKINEDYPQLDLDTHKDRRYNITTQFDTGAICIGSSFSYGFATLSLSSFIGAEILIRDNEELLKTYFKIK